MSLEGDKRQFGGSSGWKNPRGPAVVVQRRRRRALKNSGEHFEKKKREKRSLSYRVAELGGQAVRQLGDARRDLVKVDGLLAPVPLLDVHGGEGGREGERGGRAENEQTLEKKKKKKV